MQEEKKPQESFKGSFILGNEQIEQGKEALVNEYKKGAAEDLGRQVADYFGFVEEDTIVGDEREANAKQYTCQVVVMTLEEFDRLKEVEWMYKDLNDETEAVE